MLGKNFSRHFEVFSLSFFFSENRFDIPLETICMNCQILFPKKSKKNIINFSSDFVQNIVNVNLKDGRSVMQLLQ